MRGNLLKCLYRVFPFDLHGDCEVPPASGGIKVSCVINFYGRLDLLSGILHSLVQQKLPRALFEVILVEDRGGTVEGRHLAEEFSSAMQIVYAPLDRNYGLMGYSRNFALSMTRGEYVLFLDDDTVIIQDSFLEKLVAVFENNGDVDSVVPRGMASYSLIKGRYGYHDPYFMSNRCTAYSRKVLAELSGFMNHFVGQEDVEFVVRFTMKGKNAVNCSDMTFYHPPLLVPNLRKPKAVGNSFFGLRSRYPLALWMLVVLNCSRHAPLYLVPIRRYREMGRFGIGFLLGAIASLFKKEGFQYS